MPKYHKYFLKKTVDDSEHVLDEVEYIIGRGWFNCKDKRISRRHGILELLPNDCLSVSSTHSNPTFYKTKDDDTLHVLSKYERKILTEGDSFGLLLDSCWFTIYKVPEDVQEPGNATQEIVQSSNVNSSVLPGKRKLSHWMEDIVTKKSKIDAGNQSIQQQSTSDNDRAISSSTSNVQSAVEKEQKIKVEQEQNTNSVGNDLVDRNDSLDRNEPSKHLTLEGSSDNSNAVKVKIEPPDSLNASGSSNNVDANPTTSSTDSTEPVTIKKEVKQEPDDGDGVASSENNAEEASSSANNDNTNVAGPPKIKIKKVSDLLPPDSTSGSNPNYRDCCPYGIRCYRRNPVHRAEMAHPGDSDYRRPNYADPPAGAPTCPFGEDCYRRNPVHFQQFCHPNSTNPSENRRRMRQDRDTFNNTPTVLLQRLRNINTSFRINYGLDDDDFDENPFENSGSSDEDYEPDTQELNEESDTEDESEPVNTEGLSQEQDDNDSDD